MSDFTVDINAIGTHQGHVATEAGQVQTIDEGLSDGVGELRMYGVLVGPIAQPILSKATESKRSMVGSLQDLLDQTADSLTEIKKLYQRAEDDHAQLAQDVEAEVDSVPTQT